MNNSIGWQANNALRVQVEQITEKVWQEIRKRHLVKQPLWYRNPTARTFLFILILAFVFFVGAIYQVYFFSSASAASLPNGAVIATALFAAIASVFAYLQWQDSRAESSYENFYQRLRIITEQYEADDGCAMNMVSHFWRAPSGELKFRESLYVYLEVDNLEYVCGRYSLGYIRNDLFKRALRTFISRCVSAEFCTYALWLVRRAGHDGSTIKLVEYIVKSFPNATSDA